MKKKKERKKEEGKRKNVNLLVRMPINTRGTLINSFFLWLTF
jgi:hypothetical protein